MNLSEYLVVIRRQSLAVATIAVLSLLIVSIYLLVTPKRYEATTSILVAAQGSSNVVEAAQGAQLALTAATASADIVDTSVVLDKVVAGDDAARPESTLESLVSASARPNSPIIDVTATSDSAEGAARLANAVSASAVAVIPPLIDPGTQRSVNLQVIRPAAVPSSPLSPNTSSALVVALVVGLFVGVAFAILRHGLAARVDTPEDVERFSDAPVLGVVPRRSTRRAQTGHPVRSVRESDAYRAIRERIVDSTSDTNLVLMVAGLDEHDDAAAVAISLARSMNRPGERVLLCDADFRSATVSSIQGTNGSVGLSDLLEHSTGLDQVVAHSIEKGLDFLPSGSHASRSTDLLTKDHLQRFIADVGQDYERVIFCAPPITHHIDAMIVGRVASFSILVVTAKRTLATRMIAGVADLARARIAPLGIVLANNRIQ